MTTEFRYLVRNWMAEGSPKDGEIEYIAMDKEKLELTRTKQRGCSERRLKEEI